jgi:hypothetical protein
MALHFLSEGQLHPEFQSNFLIQTHCMMSVNTFPLSDVLAVAKIHPFYNPTAEYPPDPEAIQSAVQSAQQVSTAVDLTGLPLIGKKDL